MDGTAIAIIVVVVILLVISFYLSKQNKKLKEDFLTGTWLANESFNEPAGIQSMILRVGKADVVPRRAFIIIQIDDEVVFGRPVEINFSEGLSGDLRLALSEPPEDSDRPGKLDETDNKLHDYIPPRVNVSYDVSSGSMKWFVMDNDEETVYFDGLKQHIE